jgi:hypothetical protein
MQLESSLLGETPFDVQFQHLFGKKSFRTRSEWGAH